MTVADRIKNRRENLKMSQEELALKLGLKDKSSISKIEASGDKISLKNIEKISVALNCSIQSLMGWEDDRKIDHIMRYVEDFDPETKKMIDLFQNSTPEMRNAAIAVLKSGQQNHERDG